MTSLKYSANKQAAGFDLKRCFKFNLIPALIMLYFFIKQFIYYTMCELSQYSF